MRTSASSPVARRSPSRTLRSNRRRRRWRSGRASRRSPRRKQALIDADWLHETEVGTRAVAARWKWSEPGAPGRAEAWVAHASLRGTMRRHPRKLDKPLAQHRAVSESVCQPDPLRADPEPLSKAIHGAPRRGLRDDARREAHQEPGVDGERADRRRGEEGQGRQGRRAPSRRFPLSSASTSARKSARANRTARGRSYAT